MILRDTARGKRYGARDMTIIIDYLTMPEDMVYIGLYRRPVEGRFSAQCPQVCSKRNQVSLTLAEDHGCDTEVTGESAVRPAGHFFF